MKESIKSGWNVREFQRQIGAVLYERLGLFFNKHKVLELSKKGQENDYEI